MKTIKTVGLLFLGAFIYHQYQKRKGVLNTHEATEKRLDDARIKLHNFIDDFSEGQINEKEIEKTVYKIIK